MRRVMVTLSLFFAAGNCRPDGAMQPIGGHWFVGRVQKPPEAGTQFYNLYRLAGRQHVLVDEWVEIYRYYEPDCVIYQTARHAHDIFAVCGEAVPVGIASAIVTPWTFETEGLRSILPVELINGRPVQTTQLLLLPEIQALAMRQPPFRRDWAASAQFDPGRPYLRPVKRELPLGPHALGADGRPLLLDAVHEQRLDLVDALLREGAGVNARNEIGATALMIAAAGGDLPILDRLLAARADVNAQDRDGATALMFAAGVGETETVRRLLAAGADPTLRDSEGHTAIERIPSSTDQELLGMLREAAKNQRHPPATAT